MKCELEQWSEGFRKPDKNLLAPRVRSSIHKILVLFFAGKQHQALAKICDFHCWLLSQCCFRQDLFSRDPSIRCTLRVSVIRWRRPGCCDLLGSYRKAFDRILHQTLFKESYSVIKGKFPTEEYNWLKGRKQRPGMYSQFLQYRCITGAIPHMCRLIRILTSDL